jgi:chromate transporter
VALWRLAAQQPRSVWVGCVGVVCFGARLFGVPAAMILLGAALAMMAARVTAGRWERVWAGVVALGVLALAPWMLPSGGGADASAVVHSMSWPWPLLSGARGAASESAGGVGAGSIGWVFAQIGSIVFGSGYVLVAYLRSAFIEQRGWLSEAQLLDAVAVGQVTPGPVFSTATFIGYVLYGTPGALAATVGIFLPAFCYAALSGIVVPRIRASLRASAALDGLNVASLSLLGAMLVSMLRETLNAPLGMLIAGVALAMLLLLRVGTLWVLLGGALVGLLSAYAAPFGLAALRAGAVG